MTDPRRWGYDAVVVAGGVSQRLGGIDKPGLTVGGKTLLDRALEACAGARRSVVVGPYRPVRRSVAWTTERPPGGGPLAGLAAGLQALPEPAADLVVVLAADLPAVTTQTVDTLLQTAGDAADGAIAVDTSGHIQPLLATYRRAALQRALAGMGNLAGQPMRRLCVVLDLVEFPAGAAAADIDTPSDLARWQETVHDR